MAQTRKQLAFDLDTNLLKKYYPSKSYNNAYDVIKRHMQNNGFSWVQGSVYISDKAISYQFVSEIIEALIERNPWLNLCMRDCKLSNLGKEYDLNSLFDKSVKIPEREDKESVKERDLTDNSKDKSAEDKHEKEPKQFSSIEEMLSAVKEKRKELKAEKKDSPQQSQKVRHKSSDDKEH